MTSFTDRAVEVSKRNLSTLALATSAKPGTMAPRAEKKRHHLNAYE
jgi:hypothetical protein